MVNLTLEDSYEFKEFKRKAKKVILWVLFPIPMLIIGLAQESCGGLGSG
jgi:hypothetical protein